MSNKFKHHFFIRLFLFILLSLSLTLPINEIQALAEETGSGTIDSPYLIYSVEGLKGISNELGAHYKLMNDIDLTGEEWTPIGTNSTTFTGTLDGNGYKIHNLVIDQSSTDYIGLFGYTSNTTVTNLELSDVQITGRNNVGSLIGYTAGTTIIENVKLTGNSTVNGASNVGGLVGNGSGTLTTENVKLTENSTVHGANNVGGLFGSTNTGTLNKSYALGTVTASGNAVGGLIGSNIRMYVNESYSTSNVSGEDYVGGLIGQIPNQSYNIDITNNYALGDVSGTRYVGGLIGYTDRSSFSYTIRIENNYAAGRVTGTSNISGLVGSGSDTRLVNSYYDGLAVGYISSSVSRLTSAMKTKANYVNWDFETIWGIDEDSSYPYLLQLDVPNETSVGLPVNEVAGGHGTEENPYLIETIEHLKNMKYELGAHYKLMNDIDLTDEEWTPIGTNSAAFTGTLDGNGYKIHNLVIDQSSTDYIGLFGYTSDVTVTNLELSDIQLTGRNNVGSLIGYTIGTTIIENVKLTGSSSVNGASNVGGLVGNGSGTLTTENVKLTENSTVHGANNVGGLFGSTNTGTLNKSYALGTVTASGNAVGGLIGSNIRMYVNESYSTSNVSGEDYVGGLIGQIPNQSYNIDITNNYALGDVSGTRYVGGLIGYTDRSSFSYTIRIENNYAAGRVTGTSNISGLVGSGSDTRLVNSYYDGLAVGYISSSVSRLTSAMKTKANYVNWDFETIWGIDEDSSYPYLLQLDVPNETSVGLPVNEVAGGHGTEENPYLIETIEHLKNMKYELGAHYKLMNDIDLTDEEWTPIGTNSAAFTGTLDGNGYKIHNLVIDQSSTDYIGLFGYTSDVTVTNLELSDIQLTGRNNVGSLIGYTIGTTIIENVKLTGSSSVNGASNVGGLVGNGSGTLTTENVKLTENSTVHGANNVGGLFGSTNTGTLNKSYALGTVTASGNAVGGLIGSNIRMYVNESYSTSNVSGEDYVGGLIGQIPNQSYNIDITNNYALGDVSGTRYVGGLIGYTDRSSFSYTIRIENNYAAGRVTGTSNISGLVGSGSDTRLVNSYYDGLAVGYISSSVSRLTSAMKTKANYVNWDFETIWGIDEDSSYPYLLQLDVPNETSVGLPVNEVAGGHGTEENPYLIETIEHLKNMKYELGAHYKLMNDIDLTDEEWTPIGTNSAAFTGTLDGNGYKIHNLVIDQSSTDYIGLFGYTSDVTVTNLELSDIQLTGRNNVGSLIGYTIGTTIIENVKLTGSSSVNGASNVGGLVGNGSGTLTTENVKLTENSTVHGANNVGGLFGSTNTGTLNKSYALGTVTASGNAVGGLIGSNIRMYVNESYSTSNVSGEDYVGGLIGQIPNQSYNIDITNNYALGDVSGTRYVGGLIGYTDRSSFSYTIRIENNYAAGRVTGTSNISGLVGSGSDTRLVNSYYDGLAVGYISSSVSRLTSAMKTKANYVNWDFETIWGIDEDSSYPYLLQLDVPNETSVGLPVNEVAGGHGTEENPYLIETIEHLKNMKYELGAHYKLMNDIDLTDEEWTPIGTNSAAFTGTLDGNGYKIHNLVIDQSSTDYIGLFGYTSDVTVTNLELSDIQLTGRNNVGSLIGYTIGTTIIENVKLTGSSSVNGASNVGGLVGNGSGTLTTENVKLTENSTVHGANNVGGLFGSTNTGTLNKSYALGTVTASGNAVGGLIGSNIRMYVNESYSTSNVSGEDYVGGLIGQIPNQSYNIDITNNYALGDVSGTRYVGGLIGYTDRSSSSYTIRIENNYAAGRVTGTSNISGLIGFGSDTRLVNSYYDRVVTDLGVEDSYGRTTVEMMEGDTYVGWDFSTIWGIEEGFSYPYLRLFNEVVTNPLSLSAETINEGISLSWSAVDSTSSYNIYRSTNSGEPYDLIASNVQNTVYLDTTVDNGNTYFYVVTSITEDGESDFSNEASASLIPLAPSEVEVTTGDGEITLTWGEVPNVTTYNIYRSTQSGGPYISIAQNINETNYIDIDVSNNVNYYYVITAVNNSGESEYSLEVSGIPSTLIPTIPVGINTVNGDGEVTVSWGEVTNATTYNVYRSTTIGGPYILVAQDVNETSYIDVDVTNDTTYYYVVTAVNEHGESGYSEEISGTPGVLVPSAPVGISIVNGDGEVTVSWGEVTNATTYNVYRSTTIDGPYISVAQNVNETNYIDVDVTNNTTYYYVVTAVNEQGESEYSEEVSGTPGVLVPSAPVGISIVNGDGEVTVSWGEVTNATTYNVYRSTTVDGPYISVTQNVTATNYIDVDLTNNTTYYYVVTAVNEQGESEYSEGISGTPGVLVPSAPTDITIVNEEGQVTVSWGEVTNATTYNVYRSTTINGPYISIAQNINETNHIDIDVMNNVNYYYVITAVNNSGESEYSEEVSGTPGVLVPSAPAGISIMNGDGEVTVTWGEVTNATTYNVYRSTTIDGPYISVTQNVNETNYIDVDVTNNTTYYYVVTAVNEQGESEYSEEISVTPGVLVPSAPTDITIVNEEGQVTVSWGEVTNATTYNVYRSTTINGPYISVAQNVTATNYIDVDVTNNTTYYYVVTAVNEQGESEYSEGVSSTPGVLVPSAPTGITIVNEEGQVTVSWGEVTNATTYNVYRSTTINGPYISVAQNVNETNYIDVDITNNTTYYYVVTAVNEQGESGYSEEVSETPEVQVPSAPTDITIVNEEGQVTVSWGEVTNATTYNVYRSTTINGPYISVAQNVTATNYIDVDITNNTTYYYVITAVNEHGESGYSEEISETPEVQVPSAPTDITIVNEEGQVTVSWGEVTNATTYNVYRSTTINGPYISIAQNINETNYIDIDVTNNVNYYYVITAVNNSGESEYSEEISGTPGVLVPSAPTDITIVNEEGQVTVSWGEVTNATTYNVYRSTTINGPYISVAQNVTATNYIDVDITNNTTYYYVVTAVNEHGESGYSEEISETPVVQVPSAPTDITIVNEEGQVTVSWGEVTNATTYNVYRSTTINGPYISVAQNVTATNYIDVDITNNTTYYYVVTAVNEHGESEYSEEISETPEVQVPSAPTDITIVNEEGQVTVSWGEVTNATTYNVYRSTTINGPYISVAQNVNETNYIDVDITNDTTYYYVVTAVNEQGESGYSEEISETPVVQVPSAPTDITIVNEEGQVTVSWGEVTNATTYNVYRSTTINGPYISVAQNVNETNYIDVDVTNNTTYYYVVTAVNEQGESEYSEEISETPEVQVPSAPTDITIVNEEGQVTVSWGEVTNATTYNVYRSTTINGPYISVAQNVTATNYIDVDITNNTTYYYVVTAVNEQGESGYSEEVSETPEVQVPSAPTDITIVNEEGQVTVSWGEVTNATTYNVYRSTTVDGPYISVAQNVTATNYIDVDITNNTTYYYVVTAVNEHGESGYSEEISGTPGVLVPSAPVGISILNGDGEVTVSWGEVTNATTYNVYRSTTINGPYISVAQNVTATNYIDVDITNNTTYYYVVTAVNEHGESGYSEEISGTPGVLVPSAPTDITIVNEEGQVTVSWGEVTNATTYNVYRSTTVDGPYISVAQNVNETSYIDIDIANNTTYYYVVTALNEHGESEYSEVIVADPEATIANLVITMEDGAIFSYDLSINQINDFVTWFENRANGEGQDYYKFEYDNRVDYIVYEYIMYFSITY
ncbi:hypothetical protein V1503_12100 [Bacillus sp. SCS-151]|uniref:hypothetical protein n=1 Tax=Nanhaiella sioensis TaxID=3115293 RepID=UPI003979350E